MAIVYFHPQKLSPEELAALKASLAQPFMVGLGMASEVLYTVSQNWAQLNWGTTVLDVCCGTSTIGPTLALEGKGVVGVELCQEPVEATRVNTLDNKLKTLHFKVILAIRRAENLKRLLYVSCSHGQFCGPL
ncbi:tRNA -methyltransferase-like protein A [Camelus dromedarius]|uniref:tRNA-methyltransferase-like protein A n=1 Tax=Camelus dromedarius TaxID=9838 RepID=A0A5N4E991_CAMDR|nr:tRNA -methyltransferase-like protein A [Camelus dromedarius]